jgi:hypothetical protein
LAGELKVRVRDRGENGTLLVEPPSGQAFYARAPIGSLAGTLIAGEMALAMIRPTGVKLCRDGSDDYHLSGRVTDVAFRGRGYEHAIDLDGSTRLTGVFADVRAARGETVRLRLDPAGCHLFPADQEDHQTRTAERAGFVPRGSLSASARPTRSAGPELRPMPYDQQDDGHTAYQPVSADGNRRGCPRNRRVPGSRRARSDAQHG